MWHGGTPCVVLMTLRAWAPLWIVSVAALLSGALHSVTVQHWLTLRPLCWCWPLADACDHWSTRGPHSLPGLQSPSQLHWPLTLNSRVSPLAQIWKQGKYQREKSKHILEISMPCMDNSNCLWPELALVGSSICIESVRLEWTGVMLIYLALVISYHLSHLLHLANTITFSVFSDNKSSEFFGTEFLDLQQGQLYLEHWQL